MQSTTLPQKTKRSSENTTLPSEMICGEDGQHPARLNFAPSPSPRVKAKVNVKAEGIPDELKERPQWVCWKYEKHNGRPRKVPKQTNGKNAGSDDPSTWTDFRSALAAYERGDFAGVGYMFSVDDPYCGVDLDACHDPDSGALTDWARSIVESVDTYTEVSPSGFGVKLIARASLPIPLDKTGRKITPKDVPTFGTKTPEVAMYDKRRFWCFTGHRLGDSTTDIQSRQNEVASVYDAWFDPKQCGKKKDDAQHDDARSLSMTNGHNDPDENAILQKARESRNGAKFDKLWSGDTFCYGSHSEADLALCSLLAFYTGPNEQMLDTIFRHSGLMRDKWTERDDYRKSTMEKALSSCREFYRWNRSHNANGRANNPNRRSEASPTNSRDGKLPTIDAGIKENVSVSAAAWEAVKLANERDPQSFRYGGLPARIEFGDGGEPIIRTADEERWRHYLGRIALWEVKRKVGDNEIATAVSPPRDVVRDMLAEPNMPLPTLSRIVEAPVFALDGTLQTTPGYHSASRTYYVPAKGFKVPDVADRPTGADIESARLLLTDELLHDFPFVSDAELANTAALLLLPFARDLIDGATPLHLFEKPSPGTGATLLVDAITQIATGRSATTMTEGRDEDEWRKRITAKLRSNSAFVLIDNLRRRLDSSAVAAAITSPTWEDRLLGVSETIRIPVRAAWIATGNNPAVSSEMARRIVRIRLDAKIDRPWLRDGFRHADLRGWTIKNRGELVWACLTLIRAWIVARKPSGPLRLGMFESWSQTMGGILQVAGIPGFLSNLAEFYDSADEEGAEWRTFVWAWLDKYGHRDVKAADLYELIKDGATLPVGDGSEQSQKIRLGKLLAEKRDRVFQIGNRDGKEQPIRVERGSQTHRAFNWKLVSV